MSKLRIKLALWKLWRLIKPESENMMKGYKTIAFNVVMGLLVIVAAFTKATVPSADDVMTALDTIWAIVTVVGNVVLRFKTNTPIFRSR